MSFLAPDDTASYAWRQDFIETFLSRDAARFGITLPPEQLRRFSTDRDRAVGFWFVQAGRAARDIVPPRAVTGAGAPTVGVVGLEPPGMRHAETAIGQGRQGMNGGFTFPVDFCHFLDFNKWIRHHAHRFFLFNITWFQLFRCSQRPLL